MVQLPLRTTVVAFGIPAMSRAGQTFHRFKRVQRHAWTRHAEFHQFFVEERLRGGAAIAAAEHCCLTTVPLEVVAVLLYIVKCLSEE